MARPVLLFLLFGLLPHSTVAQSEFEQRPDFLKLQAMLTEGIDQKNLRKQALAWYYWAMHDEEMTGLADSAFQYLAKSAEKFAASGDSLAFHRVRSDLADRMSERGLWDEALKMQTEALAYAQRTKNLPLETHLLAHICMLYSTKGDAQKALKFKRDFRAKNSILRDTLLEIKLAVQEVKNSGAARRYAIARYEASNALRLAEQIQRLDFINWGQYTTGYYSLLDRDYSMAIFFLKKAINTTPRSNVAMRRDIFRYLAEAYAGLDSLEIAWDYASRALKVNDTLLAKEREAAVQRIALQFDTREKRKAIELLEEEKSEVQLRARQQRIWLATLGVALAAVLLALFAVVREYRHRIRADKVIAAQREEINQQKIRELESTLKIETMQSMLAGIESERQRVAQDLHDSVGGLLAAAKIQLESLTAQKPELSEDEDWNKIRELLDETVAETRHIARNMQPSALLEFGLVTALRDLTARVKGKGVPHISFQHIGEFGDLDRTTALNCYRIVQELVQNSLKHARATEILVQITRTDNQIALLVEDDGAGFDPENAKKGMGTDNLLRRAQFLKGEMNVQSSKGQGTSTLVTVPLG
jgi:signal transduction histidine kinase